jgi:hypothetical protein
VVIRDLLSLDTAVVARSVRLPVLEASIFKWGEHHHYGEIFMWESCRKADTLCLQSHPRSAWSTILTELTLPDLKLVDQKPYKLRPGPPYCSMTEHRAILPTCPSVWIRSFDNTCSYHACLVRTNQDYEIEGPPRYFFKANIRFLSAGTFVNEDYICVSDFSFENKNPKLFVYMYDPETLSATLLRTITLKGLKTTAVAATSLCFGPSYPLDL